MANDTVVGILKAILTADPTQFVAGMRQAASAPKAVQSSVADLGKEITKLTPQAERMVKAFSGDKLLYQANNLTAAVEKLGGVSRLTDAEQKRVNATVTEAIAKYTALGKTAPASVLALEKATRQSESAFSSMGQRILETAAGFVTAQAAISAFRTAMGAVSHEISDLVMHGSAVADVSDNFERLTTQAGLTGKALLGALREGSHNTIADFELMKAVNSDLAAGLKLTEGQYRTLAAGAFALAQATGGDVNTAFDTVNEAMLTGRTRSLALLTGRINETKAEEDYARKLGVTKDELTEAGKMEAHRSAILEAFTQVIQRLGVQTDGLDERVGQLQARWRNFNDELGKTVANSPVLNAAFSAVEEAFSKALGVKQEDLVKGIAHQIDVLAISVISAAQTGVSAFGFFIKEGLALYKLVGDVAQLVDLTTLSFRGLGYGIEKALNVATLGKAPGATAKDLKETYDEMITLTKGITERGVALKQADRDQAAVDATGAALNKTLDQMRERMIAAGAAATNTANANKDAATGARNAAAGFGAQGEALIETGKEAEAFGKKMRELSRDVARGLSTLSDSEFVKEFGSKLDDAIRDMERFGMTGTKVSASIRQAFARLVNIELRQLNQQMNELASKGVPHLEALSGPLDAEMERQAAHDKVNDELVTSSRSTAKTLESIDLQRAEFGIEQAKRWGAGWEQIAKMESALAKARLDAEISDENRAFTERTRLLNASNVDDVALLNQYTAEHNAKVQAMVEAWRRGEQAKRDELAMTHNVALRFLLDLRDAIVEIGHAFSSNIAEWVVGLRGFKDTFANIWQEIRRSFAKVLADMLDNFVQGFLKGVIKSLTDAALGQKIGGFIGSLLGGGNSGGGGTGNIISSVTGKALPKLIGAGATAATAATAFDLAPDIASAAGLANATALGSTAVGGSVAGAAGGGIAGSLGAFFTNPWTIGIGAALVTGLFLAKHFGKDAVNKPRDQFLAQFGDPSDKGDSGGAHKLAAILTSWGQGDGGGPLFAMLQGARKDMAAFRSAEQAIAQVFKAHGKTIQTFHMGGMVPGNGEVPALLLGGERVLNRQQAQAYSTSQGVVYNVTQQITIEGLLSMDTAERFRREILVPLEQKARLLNIDYINGPQR